MTSAEATVLADAFLSSLRGEPCAAIDWSASETRTHWRFYWNTVAAMEGRAAGLKGVDPVAVDKRTALVLLDPKRTTPHAPCNAVFPAPPAGPVETKERAAAIAQAWLDATMEHWSSLCGERELQYGWAFSWNSDAYLRTGAIEHALGGNGPLIVLRETGALYALGSATSFESVCAEFERGVLGRR
jgi:hypothetical protein